MRAFLGSQTGRRGSYSPDELSMLERLCKAAAAQLGASSRDEIDSVAARILALYDMGIADPDEIMRAVLLAFSTDKRLGERRIDVSPTQSKPEAGLHVFRSSAR